MRESHLKVAKVVNQVPRYFRLFRDALASWRTLDQAVHWVWLWLPEAADDGSPFSKAAIRSILKSMKTGEFFREFPVNSSMTLG